jgi:hypothetical protein
MRDAWPTLALAIETTRWCAKITASTCARGGVIGGGRVDL